MEHKGDQAGQGTDDQRHGGVGRKGHHASCGIEHSIRPGVSCPETVLVSVMTDGSYLLMGYPRGEPAAFVVGKDTDLLRRELAAAFGSPDRAPSGSQGEAL